MKLPVRQFAILAALVAITFTPATVRAVGGGDTATAPTPATAAAGPGELAPSDHWQSRAWQVKMPLALCEALYRGNPQLLHGHPLSDVTCTATETMSLGPSQQFVTPDGGTYYVEPVNMELCSGNFGGCSDWKNDVNGQAQWNGSYVYQFGTPSCTPTNYWPFSQSITWCGTANNGGQGSGYISMGDNFTVYPAIGSCNAYQRVNVALNGHESPGGSSTGGC